MLGQSNHAILDERRANALRKSSTDAELRLWTHLRAKRLAGFKFRRQHPFGDYILDFVCIEQRLVVEVDGSQHLDSVRDSERDRALTSAGFRVLRYWNNDVLARTDAVLETILIALNRRGTTTHHPLPGPPLEGEGEVERPVEKT